MASLTPDSLEAEQYAFRILRWKCHPAAKLV